ncbi:MAG: DNA polymerase III subunit delta' [Cyanobacteriota bacterium]|nr:DNA polymerase III subunit delta' [Cyanobacteriota bacterium]
MQPIGQTLALQLLQRAIARDRIAPAYLFAGAEGVGRQLAARTFAALLLGQKVPPNRQTALKQRISAGNHPDFLWVQPTYLHQGKRLTPEEAAAAGVQRKARSQIRIEQIREIAEFVSRSPLEAPRSMVVIEEAQLMGEAAANALLKTLEEPGRATLVLIAPSGDALLPTLVSRCQRIPFSPLSREELQQVLERVGRTDILSQPDLLAIAQGSPGAAIRAWEQLQAIPPDLLQKLMEVPRTPLQALELAKEIDKTLEVETQLWSIDYLQYTYWQNFLAGAREQACLHGLEQARQALLSYAQPRLVWEVTLLGIFAVRNS